MAKKKRLGRGLDELLPKANATPKEITRIPLADLHVSPYQPRKIIDPEALLELTQSIATKGVLQPLLVRPRVEGGYEIVAGERRFRASTQAGLETVPVIIRTLSDRETLEIAIIENLQRENLNALEEAHAFQHLMEFGANQEEIASIIGKARSTIANSLRLLQLSEEAQNALLDNKITAGHARAILSHPPEDHALVLEQILAQGLSVRQAEKLILPKNKPLAPPQSEEVKALYQNISEDLTRLMQTRVSIAGKNKGKLEIHFHSPEELQRVLEFLGYRG